MQTSQLENHLKVVICADYLGIGAVEASTTGFQSLINDWIEQASFDKKIQIVVYCIGNNRQQYSTFPNVTYKQYKPNLSNRFFLPLIPPSIFPFLIDLVPIHSRIIKDIINENPDVIHTFKTFAVSDISGYLAAKAMKSRRRDVTLVNTIMAEADTNLASYFQRIVTSFYQVMDSQSLFRILVESAYGGVYTDKANRKFSLSKFLFYINSGTYSYLFLKLFEIIGVLQDYLVEAGKLILKILFPQRYKTLQNNITQRISDLREFPILSSNLNNQFWLNYLAKPIQLIYDFIRRGDERGSRAGINRVLANIVQWCLRIQISEYLNQCDRVTISRPEDIIKYHIKAPVWELPLGCNLSKFRVYEPSIEGFIDKINLETSTYFNTTKLIEFVQNPDITSKKCIIYVGRLSDEKNILILIDACKELLERDTMTEKIHFLFVGTGFATSQIEKRLGNNATVAGLVPHNLLPDIYNIVRLRHGFFVSASDTETYGITHEEAIACGLPLVAMEKGTRGHFYCPEDKIGNFKIEENQEITQRIKEYLPSGSESKFIFALNGLCIPDYSQDYGLPNLATKQITKELVKHSLVSAMYSMAMLPDAISITMSNYASEFALQSKFGSEGTWQILKKIYINDWASYHRLIREKWHFYL